MLAYYQHIYWMELNFILDILLCLSVICLKMYRHIWFQTYFIKSCWTFPKQLLTDLINWFCFHLLKTNTLLEEHKRSGEIIAKQSTYLSKQTFFLSCIYCCKHILTIVDPTI